MSASAQEIRRSLDATLFSVRSIYESCTVAAKKLVRAYSVLLRAEETREIKNNARTVTAHARAESAFKLYKREYFSSYKHYEELLSEASALYTRLIESEESHRAARKITAEMLKFETRAELNKEALQRRLSDAALAFDEPTAEEEPAMPRAEEPRAADRAEPIYREEPRESYAPPYYSAYGGMYSPKIAPASIDISGIVEDAVRAAMTKFVSVFEKRMDEYEAALDEIRLPDSTSADAPVASEAKESLVPEMERAVAFEEERILEKLGEIVEKLKTVSESLTELGASAIELAGAEAAAVEEQRRANEMQRRTARDIQGVLVNQRLISNEAAELAGAQAAAIEEQKANIENQKLINAAQEEIAEMEKSIIDASTALGESVRELMSSQRSLIGQQASLINANAKNLDSQRELTERQAEVTALQRAAEKEHKALTKEPRRKARQRAEGAEKTETVTEAAEGIVEEKATEISADSVSESATEAVANTSPEAAMINESAPDVTENFTDSVILEEDTAEASEATAEAEMINESAPDVTENFTDSVTAEEGTAEASEATDAASDDEGVKNDGE